MAETALLYHGLPLADDQRLELIEDLADKVALAGARFRFPFVRRE